MQISSAQGQSIIDNEQLPPTAENESSDSSVFISDVTDEAPPSQTNANHSPSLESGATQRGDLIGAVCLERNGVNRVELLHEPFHERQSAVAGPDSLQFVREMPSKRPTLAEIGSQTGISLDDNF